MNNKDMNPTELRLALQHSLPETDAANSTTKQLPAFTYVPPSHVRALDPDNTLVEGIRGAGKSFWWATLFSKPHRDYVSSVFPETRLKDNFIISQGFGAQIASHDAPSHDVLARLTGQNCTPRAIWQAVVAVKLAFPLPFPATVPDDTSAWETRTRWVMEFPEAYGQLLQEADSQLKREGKSHLILFDALDRLANTWQEIRPLAKALMQIALDCRSTHCIRLKLFIRPDMLEDQSILGFPDASKLIARKATLDWRRADLYALLFQCLGNDKTGGNVFRDICAQQFDTPWTQNNSGDAWLLPAVLRTNEVLQEGIFATLAGKTMAKNAANKTRGKPYTWLVSHLQDGREQVSPRSFFSALRKAAESTGADCLLPLDYRAIQTGVQTASQIRITEIIEDYPWVNTLMTPLRGKLTVPCVAESIAELWEQNKTLPSLADMLSQSKDAVKLPPQHIENGPEGVLLDLKGIGLIKRLTDNRIQMPDVYRVAFGLGRRGGVKPLK